MIKKIEIVVVSILVFVFPYMRIKFGITPIYFIDIFFLYLIVKFGFNKNVLVETKFIFLYVLFTFFSFLVEFLTHFSLISVYFIIRYTLPFYIFFYFYTQIKNKVDIKFLLKTLLITAIINSVFVILYSFSYTRPVLNILYKNEIFYPQKNRFLTEFISEAAQRGVTLAGGANSTSFLCLIGLAIFYQIKSRNYKFKSYFFKSEIFTLVIFVIFSSASILSMSRSAFITLFLVLIYNLKNKLVRLSLIMGLITSLIILTKTTLLDYLEYSRIVKSTELILEGGSIGSSERERVDAYTKPFEFLIEYPEMFIIGKGLSNEKVSESGKYGYFEQELEGRHGLLGAIVYDRGFIAFFCFLLFITIQYRNSFFNSRSHYRELNKHILIIMLMPLVTTHIFIDQISGIYQFTFLLALITCLNKHRSVKTI